MLEGLDTWKLLGGLGMFLLGMYLLEEAIKKLSGRAFKQMIRRFTTGRLKSILAGLSATTILQSSSAVTLMILAFVGAGIMSMENAIGVMLGSNVGTTATAWIVAGVGFKFNIESFALPFLFLGGIASIFFAQSERNSNIAKLFAGFGLLFLGLDFMKSSVEGFAEHIDMAAIPHYGLFLGLLTGLLLTAIMQSSSATMAITLTLLHSKLFSFDLAAAMVIGANIGTTVTVLLGAIGAIQVKKRVAFSHFIFNLMTGLFAVILLPLLTWLILEVFNLQDRPVIALALFHTIFNLIGVLLFLPFIGIFVKLLNRLFPEKQLKLTHFIGNTPAKVGDVAISALKNETLHLLNNVLYYNLSVLKIEPYLVFSDYDIRKQKLKERFNTSSYENIKLLQAEIFTYAAEIQSAEINEAESSQLQRYLHSVRMLLHAAKTLKDIKQDLEAFESEENVFLNQEYQHFRKRLIKTYLQISTLLSTSEEDKGTLLINLLKTLQQEDKAFLSAATTAIHQNELKSINLSTAILVNRAFIQSARQVLLAIRELLLNELELAKVEKGLESDEMLTEQEGLL